MKPFAKVRIDQLLVQRGLADSRQKAQALVLAGEVLVNSQKAEKPGQTVSEDSSLQVLERMPYVSRGGFKLAGALDGFGIDVKGRVCVDIGASTGGFTDCLLQRGAARVYVVDVGPSQLDWKVRQDRRVVVHEYTNARYIRPDDFPEPCSLAVCDVSFISVTLILPAIRALLTPDGEMVILIKPQFEVGRRDVGKGGIVRDPELHAAACNRVREFVEEMGFRTRLMDSPITGAEGNKEFLLHAAH
jgi:23S rRNA (cytidine1920-2'-O)/16S rRNA (cytidine1409-2'-O)-methyltransferase